MRGNSSIPNPLGRFFIALAPGGNYANISHGADSLVRSRTRNRSSGGAARAVDPHPLAHLLAAVRIRLPRVFPENGHHGRGRANDARAAPKPISDQLDRVELRGG